MRGKNKKPAGPTSRAVPHSGGHLAQELLHDVRQSDGHGTEPAFSSGTRRTPHALQAGGGARRRDVSGRHRACGQAGRPAPVAAGGALRTRRRHVPAAALASGPDAAAGRGPAVRRMRRASAAGAGGRHGAGCRRAAEPRHAGAGTGTAAAVGR